MVRARWDLKTQKVQVELWRNQEWRGGLRAHVCFINTLPRFSLWRTPQHGENSKDGAAESTCQWVFVCSSRGDLQDCTKNHYGVWRGSVLFKVGGGQPQQTAGCCQVTKWRSVLLSIKEMMTWIKFKNTEMSGVVSCPW